MQIECFPDTNVLAYAASGRKDDPRKHDVANHLVSTSRFGLSGQVLAEFYVNVARKLETALSAVEIDRWMDVLSRCPLAPIDGGLVKTGISIAHRFQIHHYDAAILAAAERLGAGILYTEDLNHGQRYGSVLVQNPFRDP